MPPNCPEQMPLHPLQAECIRMGPGEHTCVCQAGWTGDGRDCSAINNCLLPTAAGCHENATCIYVGPGQVRPLKFTAAFGTSSHPFCSAGASYPVFFPKFSSPSQPQGYFHTVLSTQSSLLQFPSQRSLPPTWWFSGSKYFLVSTLVDVRYKGLLEILISVIPLK